LRLLALRLTLGLRLAFLSRCLRILRSFRLGFGCRDLDLFESPARCRRCRLRLHDAQAAGAHLTPDRHRSRPPDCRRLAPVVRVHQDGLERRRHFEPRLHVATPHRPELALHAVQQQRLEVALLLLPALWLLWRTAQHDLGPRPLTELIHQTGLWAFRFLLLSLAVTPLRQMLRYGRLVLVRRMVGVASAVYAAAHLLLYFANHAFVLEKAIREIATSNYLLIGLAALFGLLVLAATSTDGMVRRLGGRRWQNLHRIVYLLAPLALWHFFLQSKADVGEPTLMAGLLLWLLGYRLLRRIFPSGITKRT